MMARFLRRARLLKPGEFKAAFESGSRHSEKWLSAVASANPIAGPRLGLAISKKVAANATDRNRIKRQVRESFRLNKHNLPPVDIVITARSGCVAVSNPVLRDTLASLWKRIAKSCARS